MFYNQLMKLVIPPIFLLLNEQNPLRRLLNCLRMPPSFICIRRYYEWKPRSEQNRVRNADVIANGGKCLVRIKCPAIFSIGSLQPLPAVASTISLGQIQPNANKLHRHVETVHATTSDCYKLMFLSMRVMLYIFL